MRSLVLSFTAAAALLAGATSAQAATYAIDPTHTFATFEIGHMGATTNRGRFDKKEGKIEFDRAAKTGKVEITLDITSINTGTAAFNKVAPINPMINFSPTDSTIQKNVRPTISKNFAPDSSFS